MKTFFKRLRGAVGSALVWGATWFTTAGALFSTLHLTVGLPMEGPWRFILFVASSIAATGFLTGGAFSIFLRFGRLERPLLEVKVGKVALAGAIVSALVFPAVSWITQLLVGGGLVLTDVIAGASWAAVFGTVTAAFTLKLAQQASLAVPVASSTAVEAGEDIGGELQSAPESAGQIAAGVGPASEAQEPETAAPKSAAPESPAPESPATPLEADRESSVAAAVEHDSTKAPQGDTDAAGMSEAEPDSHKELLEEEAG